MTPAWISATAAGAVFLVAVGLNWGLAKAVAANQRLAGENRRLARENDRLNNQLDTYRLWLGDPARLMRAHPDITDQEI